MEFDINNRTWKIREVTQEEMLKEMGKEKIDEENYHGLCILHRQEILLWEKLCEEQKRKTLIHELGHCYICNYVCSTGLEFNEEICVEIMSNSHDVIHEIINEYFKKDVCCSTVSRKSTFKLKEISREEFLRREKEILERRGKKENL